MGRITGVEVCRNDKLIGHAEMVSRPDIREAFPHIAHAERSGFELEVPFEVSGFDPIRFDFTGLRNFLSIGVMRLEYEPGMFESHEWPPKELFSRYVKVPSAEMFSLTSMRIIRELLEPVSRYRTLNSFRSVLDWGCGCGLLEFSIRRFLPEASVTAVDSDVEAIEWCRRSGLPGTFGTLPQSPSTDLEADAFDLVLGYSTLGRLTPAAQETWLRELHRIMKSGGYAALSVYGELLRPLLSGDLAGEVESRGVGSSLPQDTGTGLAQPVGHVLTHQTKEYTLSECLPLFDVVTYLEGAVNSEQDLIVLRKA
jgi:SAM-dependent methyltransferase